MQRLIKLIHINYNVYRVESIYFKLFKESECILSKNVSFIIVLQERISRTEMVKSTILETYVGCMLKTTNHKF